MARSGTHYKRIINQDPLFGSRIIAKLINRVMKDGKKTIAQKQVYEALDKAAKQLKEENHLQVLRQALDNIKPHLEVRSRRVGGAAYQVPTPVRGERKESLSIRWLVEAARAKSSKEFPTYADKLAAELIDACKNQGGAVKKKEDTHRMADANKAFSHFRW